MSCALSIAAAAAAIIIGLHRALGHMTLAACVHCKEILLFPQIPVLYTTKVIIDTAHIYYSCRNHTKMILFMFF